MCFYKRPSYKKNIATSNFNWSMPLAAPIHIENMSMKPTNTYSADELLDMPLSFVSIDEDMGNEELRYWLSKLDWSIRCVK